MLLSPSSSLRLSAAFLLLVPALLMSGLASAQVLKISTLFPDGTSSVNALR